MITNCHFSHLIQEQAKKYGERTALQYRDYDKGEWVPISWNEFEDKVITVSNAMVALGVKVQENVAVFSQNMPERILRQIGFTPRLAERSSSGIFLYIHCHSAGG